MNPPDSHESTPRKQGWSPERTGIGVFVLLVILAVLEYIVYLEVERNLPIMVVMNIADAALILWYFMHFGRLFGEEE